MMLVTGSFTTLYIFEVDPLRNISSLSWEQHIGAGRCMDFMYSQALTTEIIHSTFLSFPLILQMLNLISRTSKLISLLIIALNIEICLFPLRLHAMFTYRWCCYLPSYVQSRHPLFEKIVNVSVIIIIILPHVDIYLLKNKRSGMVQWLNYRPQGA